MGEGSWVSLEVRMKLCNVLVYPRRKDTTVNDSEHDDRQFYLLVNVGVNGNWKKRDLIRRFTKRRKVNL